MTDNLVRLDRQDAGFCLNQGLVHQVEDDDCAAAAISWAEKVAVIKSGSIRRSRQLLNINNVELRHRLYAKLDSFVVHIQTQQALDGIDQFLRRQ